ncbi:hypothetical protein [Bradyrhizobium centrosematis]|uniref:hypothetical protein n=1 Tax=Bradyrhizobium centrosematis TaxID=1300039 RepID=UPI00388F0B84
MSDRIRHGPRSRAERGALIQPLGMQPDLPGLCRGEREWFGRARHCEEECSEIRAGRKNLSSTEEEKGRTAIC